jgi:hypothetical protein
VGGLHEIPRSRYRALVYGDDWFGWDRNSSLIADAVDALTAIGLGLSGKKATEAQLTRRPKMRSGEEKERRPRTIAEFDVAWFMRQL